MKRIKNSAEFLINNGLLFEINRQVLHPLGLALEVTVDDDDKVVFGDIWDCRDDPEGILFSPDAFKTGQEKLDRFMHLYGGRLKTREEKLGYIIQKEE